MQKLLVMAYSILAFALVASVFGVAYAQTTTSSAGAYVGTLIAVTGLISALVGFVPAIIAMARAKTGDKKVYNDILEGAATLKGTDQWVLENKEKIATTIGILEEINPDFKAALASKAPDVVQWKETVDKDRAELERLYSTWNNSNSADAVHSAACKTKYRD